MPHCVMKNLLLDAREEIECRDHFRHPPLSVWGMSSLARKFCMVVFFRCYAVLFAPKMPSFAAFILTTGFRPNVIDFGMNRNAHFV